ncbi:MAG: alpha/beta hydrolase [Beijerinckiaceae bacterium]
MSTDALGFTHRFLPGAAGSSAPTLLLLHGTGGDEDDLLPLGHAVAPGAALLSPRGHVVENGMPRFFRRFAEGRFDEANLKAETHLLADFVAAAADAYRLDPARIVALGLSNGANIAAALMLLRPKVLAGAILLRPMLPLRPAKLPDLSRTPVLVSAGQRDPIVPQANTQALVNLLKEAGADVSVRWQKLGHSLAQADVDDSANWLREQSFGKSNREGARA